MRLDDGSPLGSLDLSDQQIDGLAYLIASPAYAEVFVPIMRGMERHLLEDLVNPSQTRTWDKNDDYLRGGIAIIRSILNFPEAIVQDSRERQMDAEGIKTVEQRYKARADAGAIGPLGFKYDASTDY